MNAGKPNTNSSASFADTVIITNKTNRLELSYDELVQLDTWLSREIPVLQDKVAKQTPASPKFFLDDQKEARYLAPDIERLNQRSQQYNQRVAEARVNTTSAT